MRKIEGAVGRAHVQKQGGGIVQDGPIKTSSWTVLGLAEHEESTVMVSRRFIPGVGCLHLGVDGPDMRRQVGVL